MTQSLISPAAVNERVDRVRAADDIRLVSRWARTTPGHRNAPKNRHETPRRCRAESRAAVHRWDRVVNVAAGNSANFIGGVNVLAASGLARDRDLVICDGLEPVWSPATAKDVSSRQLSGAGDTR